MEFDIIKLKENIRDVLRSYLYPECLEANIEHTISATSTIRVAQSFIPYCKFYKKVSPYRYTIPVDIKIRKYGTPDDGLVVSLQSSLNNKPSGSTLGSYSVPVADVPTSLDVVSCSIPITSMLGSNTKYWLVVEPQNTPSTINYYTIAKDSVDTNYWIGTAMENTLGTAIWNSLNVDIYFDIDVVDWIYQDYPRDDLSIYSFPRIAIDLVGRRVLQKWIDRRLSEYYLDLIVLAYSRWPKELDDICSYVDRALFKERAEVSGIKRIDSTDLTPATVVREDLFTRALRYNLIFQMTNQ